MNILAIDTTTANLFVAVEKDGQAFTQSYFDNRAKHSELLCVAISDLLQRAQLTFAQIDVCAVCVGPGSFTGIRIGIATVKGIATALKVKLVAINSLAFLCYAENAVSAIIDAGNGWYFGQTQDFEVCEQQLVAYDDPKATSAAQFDKQKDYCHLLLNFAKILCQKQKFTCELEPVYIRKSQAQIEKGQ